MKIHRFKRRPLSNSNIFDQIFIKLGHIVRYHDIFFKFDNGLYHAFYSYGPLFMKIHRFKRCPLSNSNIFLSEFMKLGHIVKYHDVFFKFDNDSYRTMLSRVMALCL